MTISTTASSLGSTCLSRSNRVAFMMVFLSSIAPNGNPTGAGRLNPWICYRQRARRD